MSNPKKPVDIMPAIVRNSPTDAARVRRLIERQTTAETFSDAGTRALYASDASNYRIPPALVVSPRTTDDLAAVLTVCNSAGMPVTMRGGGTSVAGNACGPGVLVDTSRHLTEIVDVDVANRTVTVEPGVVLESLNRALTTTGLRIGPDPSSGDRCTIGGMIGNNACGSRSIRWGTTAHAVTGLEVALVDGRRLTVGTTLTAGASEGLLGNLVPFVNRHGGLIRSELVPWARRVSGYALDYLLPEQGYNVAAALVGSEGTCAVVLGATLSLVEIPKARTLLVLGFPDDITAAAAVPSLLPNSPLTVEGVSAGLFNPDERRAIDGLLPQGSAWLLVEADGETPAAAQRHAERLATVGTEWGTARIIDDVAALTTLWNIRKEAAGRATRLADDSEAWPGLEDAVVPPDRLADYLAGFHRLMADHGLQGSTFGHFGEGCVHVRIGFDFATPPGVERFRLFMDEAADLIAAHGGSLSGEHGDGRSRSALLPRIFSPAMMAAFGEFKAIWDPAGLLNPGILVEPAPFDAGLRPAAPTILDVQSILAFAADSGDFRRAAQRCVGVGACVSRTTTGLMCPSYQVTGNERESTRGRARLLQEMIAGELAAEGWRSEAVREALDLCLACKGCLSDCPTGVDMASYKAEFLAHYYRHRLRPRSHYSLGWLPTWLRLAAVAPRLANLATQRLPRLTGALGGFASDQPFPSLTPRTFTRSFQPNPHPEPTGRAVLWPDTFNNHFSPLILLAGDRVLRAAGFDVRLPAGRVCCGLTRITTGQLEGARRILRRTLCAFDESEDPVVVLEPSCAATLRSDLPELLPNDPRAGRIAARVATLAEVLDAAGFDPPGSPLTDPVVQPHCHQQAVLGTEADRNILRRAGAGNPEILAGCCGLAGNFGMEPGHRDLADAVAGLHLLPAVDAVEPSRTIMADGFSCRTQISWLTGRTARHLAEVLAARLDQEDV